MSNKDENVTVVVKWCICFILYTLIFLSKWSRQLLLTKNSWHVIRESLNDGVILSLSRILIRVGDWSLQVCLHFCSYYHTPLIKTPLKNYYILYFSLSAPLKNLIIKLFLILLLGYSIWSETWTKISTRTRQNHQIYSTVQKSWSRPHFFIFCF